VTEQDSPLIKSIAVLGGTGKEGSALAKRWALNGYKVIIGSRSAEKAATAAAEINEALEGDYVVGKANEDAASEDQLDGKILVDITVPLVPPKVSTVTLPEGITAAQEAQALVGENVKVVSAFQNVSYIKLKNPDTIVDCDVFISGDDLEAKEEVRMLIEAAGMRGIDVGPLANAIVAEALTPLLIYINKKYGIKSAGIRITGIDE